MIAYGEVGVFEEKSNHMVGISDSLMFMYLRPACLNRPRKIRCVLSSWAIDVLKVDSREMPCS